MQCSFSVLHKNAAFYTALYFVSVALCSLYECETVDTFKRNHLHNLCRVSNVSSLAAAIVYKDQTSNCKMATSLSVFICLLFAVTHLVLLTQAANVALWKPVEANKTCGSPAEEYYPVSQRQESPRNRKSFTCNALITSESHNATNLVDGNLSSWWQSSASLDKASITIDLGLREKVRSITITYN